MVRMKGSGPIKVLRVLVHKSDNDAAIGRGLKEIKQNAARLIGWKTFNYQKSQNGLLNSLLRNVCLIVTNTSHQNTLFLLASYDFCGGERTQLYCLA